MLRSPLNRFGFALLFSVGITSSCTSKGDGGSGPTGSTGTIALSLSSTSATITQGSSATFVGTLTRAGGFTGDVVLTVEGAPTGVTGTVTNVATVGTVTTATITLLVGAAVVPGSYTLTVRGTGSGVTSVTGTFSLTVTAGASYTIALAPAALTIAQGANAPTAVTLTRTNFTGAVTLTLEGAPVGVTGAFAPNATTGTTSTLTITVAAAVAAGNYTLTVHGTAPGVSTQTAGGSLVSLVDQTATLTLTVTALPAAYTMVLTPTAATAPQGTSPSVAVAFTRTNAPGAIALTLEGAPAGVTAAFSPTPATGASSTLTISVGIAVTPGVYPLTVRGVTAGLTDRTATYTLTVTTAVRSNGKIVFRANNDGIHVVNPDGSGLLQLTTGFLAGAACNAGDEEPRWSPDGTKIVFTRMQSGSQEIWTMNADGSNQTKLTSTGDGICLEANSNAYTGSENPSWSPDGTKIIFTSKRTAATADERLWIMNADGTNQTQLFAKPGSAVSEPVFSPDGTTIAFQVEPTAPGAVGCDGPATGGEVWLMNADGTNPRRLTPAIVNCSFDENPSWSPDGRKIAYGHCQMLAPNTACSEDIFIINVDGTGRTNLTNGFLGEESERPAFSPDGTKIVFANGNSDSIWIMKVDGTGRTPVINGSPTSAGHPNWQTVITSVRR